LVCAINRGGKCTCSVLDQSSRADLERMAQAEREHDEAVREGEASEQEVYGPVALSAIKFIEQLPAEARGKRGDAVLRGLRQLVARACGGQEDGND
jgi:ferric-dicitrate binding protein FerR (iron transport regulator)